MSDVATEIAAYLVETKGVVPLADDGDIDWSALGQRLEGRFPTADRDAFKRGVRIAVEVILSDRSPPL